MLHRSTQSTPSDHGRRNLGTLYYAGRHRPTGPPVELKQSSQQPDRRVIRPAYFYTSGYAVQPLPLISKPSSRFGFTHGRNYGVSNTD